MVKKRCASQIDEGVCEVSVYNNLCVAKMDQGDGVQVWDVSNGQHLHTFGNEKEYEYILCVAVSEELIVVVRFDTKLYHLYIHVLRYGYKLLRKVFLGKDDRSYFIDARYVS